ncbi:apolipoprotein N-acyltransferase [Hahella sp. SMD15-11]|uniref:Apolipoprotein N-acyltransferase n=1 Tax=Thermohahella caldifontis TaxID=3142973 RepID=A0AB39UY51_9GAMM
MRTWQRLTLLTCSGAALGLTFAPFYQWWLALPLAAALWGLRPGTSPRRDALEGWLVGLGLFGANVNWVWISIHEFGYAPVWLATLLTALFAASLALFTAGQWLCLGWLARRKSLTPLTFAATWILWEWIRSGLLSGFPWLYIGTGWVDSPLAPAARWTGVYGLSGLVMLAGAQLYELYSTRTRPAALALTGTLAAAVILAVLGQTTFRTTPTGTLDVAVVQTAIPQNIKWDPAYRDQIIRQYITLSTPHWDADLILWPETALPLFYQQDAGFFRQLDAQARQTRTALGYGILLPETQEGRRIYYNGFIWQGLGSGTYRKQKLVPFGEYVPLAGLLRGLIAFFDLPMSDMQAGSPDQPLQQAQGIPVATFICYEIVYPDFVAHRSRDAQLLVTVSNDAWFGLFAGPAQHMQIARMRAVEQDKTLLRAANRGHTGIITPDGEVLDPVAPAQGGVSRGTAALRSGTTLYGRTGSLPLMFIASLAIAGTLKRRYRSSS